MRYSSSKHNSKLIDASDKCFGIVYLKWCGQNWKLLAHVSWVLTNLNGIINLKKAFSLSRCVCKDLKYIYLYFLEANISCHLLPLSDRAWQLPLDNTAILSLPLPNTPLSNTNLLFSNLAELWWL